MSNVTTSPTWVLDTVGIISKKPIFIKKIVFSPTAATNELVLRWWDEGAAIAAGTKTHKAATITGQATFTSAGNLPSTIAQYYVFNISSTTDGTAANVSKHMVATAGDNNAVILAPADLANDSGKYFDWTTYPSYVAARSLAQATERKDETIDFTDDPLYLPNLMLSVLTAGAVYIYLK